MKNEITKDEFSIAEHPIYEIGQKVWAKYGSCFYEGEITGHYLDMNRVYAYKFAAPKRGFGEVMVSQYDICPTLRDAEKMVQGEVEYWQATLDELQKSI